MADATGQVATGGVAATVARVPSRSEWRRMLRRFVRNRLSLVGAIIVLLLVVASVAAPLITSQDPEHGRLIDARQGPSAEHPFGVDQVGRDVFTRVLYGGRVSLGISVLCVALSLIIGTAIGTVSAYAGGWFDVLTQRLVDMMLAFPGILLALAIVTALGRGILPLVIAVVVSALPGYTRVVRSTVLSIKHEVYVEAARLVGASHGRIVLRHIIPNATTPLIVQSTLQLAGVLLVVASLSFLGLGLPPPTPDWGGMVTDGRAYLRSASHMVWFPGFTLALAVLGFNLLGDGLRDALDVKDAR
jgi:ABC-type dipeptide/oligopeptide/nickel transport system permease subunit